MLVELAQRRHRNGNRYHVRIDLSLRGEDIAITHEASLRPALRAGAGQRARKQDEIDPGHRHARVAVRDAFEAARRRLQDHTRRRRGRVERHAPQPAGRVARLFPGDGYGFVEATDGHEVYFRKAGVLRPGFSRLKVGSRVTFVEQAGRKGPQASTVSLAGRPGSHRPRWTPTSRLTERREPLALDMSEVVKASDKGVLLEVNAQPDRLDTDDVHVAMARDAGVLLVVGTDARGTSELDHVRLDVDRAWRGWCAARDGERPSPRRLRTPARDVAPSGRFAHHA